MIEDKDLIKALKAKTAELIETWSKRINTFKQEAEAQELTNVLFIIDAFDNFKHMDDNPDAWEHLSTLQLRNIANGELLSGLTEMINLSTESTPQRFNNELEDESRKFYELQEALDENLISVLSLIQRVNEQSKGLTEELKGVRSKLGKKGVSKHQKVFFDQAKDNLKAARWWRKASLIFGAVIACVLGYFFYRIK